jgi:hypothetical protein
MADNIGLGGASIVSPPLLITEERTTRMHISKFTAWFLFSVSALSSACGEHSEGEEQSSAGGATATEAASTMPGGEASEELGISSWEISEGSTVGYSESGERLVEFRLDTTAQEVVAIWPDGGTRPFGEFGTHGTMTPEVAATLDALLSDMKPHLTEVPPPELTGEMVDKAVYGCYLAYASCDYWGFYGIYYGWWIGYDCRIPTGTCGNYWALLY